jgi:hypothetical protein
LIESCHRECRDGEEDRKRDVDGGRKIKQKRIVKTRMIQRNRKE